MERDWRDAAREAAQDLARESGTMRRLTDAEVRELTPGYPWPRPIRWVPGMRTTTGRRVLEVFERYPDEPSTCIASVGSSDDARVQSCSVAEFERYHGELDMGDAATAALLGQAIDTNTNRAASAN